MFFQNQSKANPLHACAVSYILLIVFSFAVRVQCLIPWWWCFPFTPSRGGLPTTLPLLLSGSGLVKIIV